MVCTGSLVLELTVMTDVLSLILGVSVCVCELQQSTLPLSRNYTEARDRLRARLQKRVNY